MASRASNRSHPKLDVMERRIPKNPKYEGVQPVVDTGASLSRYLKKIEDIRQNYRIRKDELFKRMKVTTFVQLMIQVAEINAIEKEARSEGVLSARTETARTENGRADEPKATDENQNDTGKNHHTETGKDENVDDNHDTQSELMSTRSTLEGITRGVGEFDVRVGGTTQPLSPPLGVDETRPYLLLDVRTLDEFNHCHVVTAQSFPIAMLSRSVNYESKEMLAYRNQPGKIIVLYDEDERLAPKAATTMVERGYDNLFLLSGGMKVAYKHFPEGLLTGTVPAGIISPVKNQKKQSLPPSTPMRADFTHNDLYLLNQQLDDALDDKSQSSRLSRAATEATRSRNTSQMSARSTTSTVTSSRPPFR